MLCIVTGGTIDKQAVYLEDNKTFDQDSKVFGETHLELMLIKARCLPNYTIKTLFMVDSLDMTNLHRAQIAEAIETAHDNQIVVTHGTDTMPETAKFLANYEELSEKTIVLTGAMLPYSVGEESDAMFNLGNAIAFAQSLTSGVYIAMNGRAFEPHNVYKDTVAGIFRDLS